MKAQRLRTLTALLLALSLLLSLSAAPAAAEAAPPTVIYLDGQNGSDGNDGATAATAVNTLGRAYDLLLAVPDGVRSNAEATGVILLCDSITIGANFNITADGMSYSHAGTVIMTSIYGDEDYQADGAAFNMEYSAARYFQLGGPTVYSHLNLNLQSGDSSFRIYAGLDFTVGEGVVVTGNPSRLVICGGFCRADTAEPVSLTFLSGSFGTVTTSPVAASHGIVTGSGNTITVGGSAHISKVVSGFHKSNQTGKTVDGVTVLLEEGGTVTDYYAGCTSGTVADSRLVLNGGAVEHIWGGEAAAGFVTDFTLVLGPGAVLPQDATSTVYNVSRRLLAVSASSGELALTEGQWDQVRLQDICDTRLTAAFPIGTELTVDAGSKLTLAEEDTLSSWYGCGVVRFGGEDHQNPHDWDEGVVTKPATGDENGEKTFTCRSCGETKISPIISHEHDWSETARQEQTCAVDGFVQRICSVCHDTDREVFPAAGHQWDDALTCTVCGAAGSAGTVFVSSDAPRPGDGYAPDWPVQTLEAAYEALLTRSGAKDDPSGEGCIVLCGPVTVDGRHFNTAGTYAHQGTLTITSLHSGVDYRETADARLSVGAAAGSEVRFQLGGPTIFDNVIISRTSPKSLTFYASEQLTMGIGVETVNTNWVRTPGMPGLSQEDAAQVKLSAHRGYQPLGPENSFPSFIAAGELGFWAIETDAQLTKDGYLVCIHDSTIDRTYNGSGAVEDMTLSELRSYTIDTAGSYAVDLSVFTEEELKIPLFSDYLRICREYGCLPFIELKSSLTGEALSAYIRQVIDEALAAGFAEEEIIISSSDWNHMSATRALSDKVFLHHIFSDESKIAPLAALGNAGLAFNITNLGMVANYEKALDLVNKAHAAGLKVCLRAGDSFSSVRYMLSMGLDYIPTNVTTPASLLDGVPDSYESADGGKIFIRGGCGSRATDQDISIILLGGMYDFVAASNAEADTAGNYSVTLGGSAFVNRLIAGATYGGAGETGHSAVVIGDRAYVKDLYTAGDFGNTRLTEITLAGGTVENISEQRNGKAGTAADVILRLTAPGTLPGSLSLGDQAVITGRKTLALDGITGHCAPASFWDELHAEGGSIITLTGQRPAVLSAESGSKILLANTLAVQVPGTITEDGSPVEVGKDILVTQTEAGTVTVSWYTDEGGSPGALLAEAPVLAGSYWVGVSAEETATETEGVYIAATAVQFLPFTIQPGPAYSSPAAGSRTPNYLLRAGDGKDGRYTLKKVITNAESQDEAKPFKITLSGMNEAVVEIPVAGMTPGTVAAVVGSDGGLELIRSSAVIGESLVLRLEGSCTLMIFDNAHSFSDVPEDAWFYDAADFVSARGLMTGVNGGAFLPYAPVTRATLATILYRLEHQPAVSGAAPFRDADSQSWYGDAITWVAEQGIMTGSGSAIASEAEANLEQTATILYRYARYRGLDVSDDSGTPKYTDEDNVSPWALDAVRWANRVGLLTGRPGSTVTRADTAILFMQLSTLLSDS